MVESPMEVNIKDGGDREGMEKEEDEKTKNRKERKERRGMGDCWRRQEVRGLKEDTECVINLGQIESWRKRLGEGKKFTKAPPETLCR